MNIDPEKRTQITEAIEQAFEISRGSVNVLEESEDAWISHRFTSRFACNKCGTEFLEPSPQLFSFNSPLGACTNCQGYGRIIGIDMEKVIPNRALRLDELPVAPWNSPGYEDCYEDLERAAKKYNLRLDVPISELTPEEWDLLHNGRGKWYGIKGFFEWLETKKYKIHVRVKLAKYRSYEPCPQCHGSRLKTAAQHVRFRGLAVGDLFAMDVKSARLLAVLRRLKNAGNTVIVVEHDPTIIAGADHSIELGPGAGELGGEVVYEGHPRNEGRATAEHSREDSSLLPPPSFLGIRGARE